MESNEINVTTDVIIPALIIGGLFIINGIILCIIIRKRRNIVYEEYNHEAILQEEPSTSQPLQSAVATMEAGGGTMSDNEEGIELQKL